MREGKATIFGGTLYDALTYGQVLAVSPSKKIGICGSIYTFEQIGRFIIQNAHFQEVNLMCY